MIEEHKTDATNSLPEDIRLGSPVARPSKIICIGLNYADHAKETKCHSSTRAGIFMKAPPPLLVLMMM